MADGGVYIPVNLEVDEAEKQANALVKKLAKLKVDLEVNDEQLENARKQFDALQNEAKELEKQIYSIGNQNRKGEWVAYDKASQGELDKLVERLNSIDAVADPLGETVDKLTAEHDKLTESIASTETQYQAYASHINNEVVPTFGSLRGAIESMAITAVQFGKSMSDIGIKIAKTAMQFNPFVKLLKAVQPVIKRVMGLASRALIFNAVSRGFRAMSTEIRNIISGNTQLSKSLGALKGAFITAFEPIISWIIPVLNKLINLITQLMGAFANFTAGLFGKTAQQAQDNAKALDKQAKSAKGAGKAMKSLMGIDEINQLSDNSGGGGSSGSATYNNDFSFNAEDWFKNLGVDIATRINEAIASVNWKKIGVSIGDKLRQTINVANDFLKTMDFKKVGQSIAELFNGTIGQINPRTLGETLFNFFKSGVDILWGFITTFNWSDFVSRLLSTAKKVAVMFADAMRNIDWYGIAYKAYTFLREAMNNADWWEIAKNILEGLARGLLGLVTILWEAFKGIVHGVIDLVKNLLGIKSPSTVFADIGTMMMQGLINGIKAMAQAVVNVFVSLWQSIKNVFATVGEWFTTTFTNAWNKLKEIFGKGGSLYNGIKETFSAIWEGIKSTFSAVGDWFRDTFSSAWEKVKGVFSKGGETFEGIKEGISETFKRIVNGLIDGINAVIAKPFDAINIALNKIRNLSIAGLTPFKGKISLITVPRIPHLAQGTVVPPNNKFLAMLGDNTKETEVVSPLSTMKEALMEALAQSRQNVTVNVDGRALFDIVVGQNNAEVRRTGESPLMV